MVMILITMSFVRDQSGVLARDLYPFQLSSLFGGYNTVHPDIVQYADVGKTDSMSILACANWQIVPADFETVCEWAYVSIDTSVSDWTRVYHLLYKQPSGDNEANVVYPVTLRIQGFLQNFDLSVLGSWDGESTNAVKAVQFLSLTSGGLNEPWIPTQLAIHNIRQLIRQTLSRTQSSPSEVLADPDASIYMTRRVFTKVRGSVDNTPSVLDPTDDPHNWGWRVASDWRVTEKLQIGRLLDDGRIVSSSHLALSKGDFVDVGFEFAISNRGRRGVAVHLCMTHVLQLLPSYAVAEVRLVCS